MTARIRKDIPAPGTGNFDQRVREELQRFMGLRGDTLDRALTVRDMKALGLVKVSGPSGETLAPGPVVTNPVMGGALPVDSTAPPTPTGFALTAGVSNVYVTTDPPNFIHGGGYERTILYGVRVNPGDPLPTFADATRLSDFMGEVYAYPTEPGSTWHMWITWRTVGGVESVTPAGGVNGMVARTGEDVSALWAIFGTLVADAILSADISADQITAGSIRVGGYLQSSNYVISGGVNGWRIDGSGNAVFRNATMYGGVYASYGSIGGININASGLNSGAFTGFFWPASGTGFHLGPNGLLLGNPTTGRYLQLSQEGNLYAPQFSIVNGVANFSGQLSAAGGTFAGSLQAASGTFYGGGSFNGNLTAQSFTTIGGRFTADSSGLVIADRVDIRRRDAIATGTMYLGREFVYTYQEMGDSGGYYEWRPSTSGARFLIDTGIDSWDAVDFFINQPLHCVVRCTSSHSWWSGGGPGSSLVYNVLCSAKPSISSSLFNSGSGATAVAPRIFIEVTVDIQSIHPSLNRIRLDNFQWSLFKA